MAKQKTEADYEREALAARHREDERDPLSEAPPGSAGGEFRHGAWGGGTAVGGLGGTNQGAGTPDAEELEAAGGSGNFDVDLEAQDDPPFAGHAGGAVGGTPAGKRSRGDRVDHSLSPEGSHRGDSTIGSDPPSTERRR